MSDQPTDDSTDQAPSLADITAFARRHGLGGLAPDHLARMRELVVPVARFGLQVRRPPRKEDAPAAGFRPPGA